MLKKAYYCKIINNITSFVPTPYQPTQEEIDDIELRDESVQDLMSRPPSWLLRWGTWLVLFILTVFVGISWWVQYPDLVKASIIISTPEPPIEITAKVSGNLNRLFVRDGQTVKLGDKLAVLHSVADVDAVLELQQSLKAIDNLSPDSLLDLNLPINSQLGELQNAYASFLQYLENYRLFLKEKTEVQQIPFLRKDIDYTRKLDLQLLLKDSILMGEYKLVEQKVKRLKEAKSFGGVAANEVEQAEAELLQQQRGRHDLSLQSLNYQMQINSLKKQIKDIRQRTHETAIGRYLLLKESYQRLRAEVDAWTNNYILSAPIAGKVALHQIWSEKQHVNSGTPLMRIIPESSGLIGRANLPVIGSGKVEVGQKVNIELLAFPRYEYGMLEGKVENIALLQQGKSLTIEVSLPNGMTSNYKKQLAFRPNMEGQAEIITKPRRLLQRFLDSMFGGK
jgi:multidrug efflux pump subunit AcrA (membrane-fusion protein)